MTATTELDAPDEPATDQALETVAAVAADQLASGDEGTPWLAVMGTVLAPVLVGYLTRTTEDIFRATGQPLTPEVRKRVARVVQTVIDDSAAVASQVAAAHVADVRGAEPGQAAEAARTAAEGLARAVVVPGRESARFQVATDLGAIYKVWRTRRDNRVRVTHGGLEGNRVPLNNSFVTFEGDELRFPGDPLAPIRATANCRCRLSYLVPK